MEYAVTTFYKFTSLPEANLQAIKKELERVALEHKLTGLLLLAQEGVNATISGSDHGLLLYKDFLEATFGRMYFKDSRCENPPFKRFKVKIKKEIVQLQRTDIVPSGNEVHVSPQVWDEETAGKDVIMIDVRNWYESKIGTFKNAIVPKTWKFSQFPDWLKKAGIPKNKKVGIFCTGGIRCEKAAVAMKEQGYDNVFQLDGGILNYIENNPNKNFTGECFVFDHRVAVGQDLQPSKEYSLCVSCGNAGAMSAVCVHCQAEYKTCDDCIGKNSEKFCSKNCRNLHHVQLQA